MIFKSRTIALLLCTATLSQTFAAQAQSLSEPEETTASPDVDERSAVAELAPDGEPQGEPAAQPEPARLPPSLTLQEIQARAAFQRGDQLYLEGDYSGAVRAFEEAYALSGRIEMLFNLANAHERLGNYAEATVALRGYIPHSPESQREALEKRLKRFEALVAQKQAAALEAEAAAKEFPVDRAIGIGLLTLGGAGIITGTAFAISAAGARSDLEDICVEGTQGRLCPAEAESLLNRDKTYSLVADLSFIAGAALTASGLYLVIRSGKDDEGGEIRASAAPGGLLIGGNF